MTSVTVRSWLLCAVLTCGCGSDVATGADAGAGGSAAGGGGGQGGSNSGGTASGGNASGGTNAGGAGGGGNLAGAGGANNACSFSRAPVAPVAPDPMASLEARAVAEKMNLMDLLIGRYLRGEIAVYRGTAQARDNASALANVEVYGPRPDGTIPTGPALASLKIRMASRVGSEATPNGRSAFLAVHGLSDRKHIILEQPEVHPGMTRVSQVTPLNTTGNMLVSCSGCAPNLWDHPASIAFTDLTATGVVSVFMGEAGKGGRQVDVTARTVASANLAVAAPCSLRFEELALLNSSSAPDEIDITLASFAPSGEELVWHTGGSFQTPSSPCPTYNPYMIDVWVDAHDLGRYGTRNFQMGMAHQACPPAPPATGLFRASE